MPPETGAGPAPRPGIFERLRRSAAEIIGTTQTRIDTFSADVEARILRVVSMLIWTAVAFFSLSAGIIFAMLTIMFGFDLPPRYAFGIPALLFLAVGLVAALLVRHKKRTRPGRR